MVDNARQISEALTTIPCIGDGDTGYGNAVNVKRTVKGYAQAGMCLYIHTHIYTHTDTQTTPLALF
jgi:2-methylisocitrate lyase-like PEP mutase family enzyme